MCWDLITESGLRGAGAPRKLGEGRSARAKMCRLGWTLKKKPISSGRSI